MTSRKKRIFAVALVIWLLGLFYLGSKSLDEFQSGKMPSDGGGTVTLKNIMFPSLKLRDQE
ncbi:MAG: hypothetical protein FWG04_03075 [Desulfovibrionaceae bacterium]|nr:hypothetical protein [Desulfovibrionaceae bacterium]